MALPDAPLAVAAFKHSRASAVAVRRCVSRYGDATGVAAHHGVTAAIVAVGVAPIAGIATVTTIPCVPLGTMARADWCGGGGAIDTGGMAVATGRGIDAHVRAGRVGINKAVRTLIAKLPIVSPRANTTTDRSDTCDKISVVVAGDGRVGAGFIAVRVVGVTFSATITQRTVMVEVARAHTGSRGNA